MGKYGEEGDRLLFKILNSGDCLAGFTDEELREKNALKFAAKACEKGLRYDLTVPFARFVVQHRNDLLNVSPICTDGAFEMLTPPAAYIFAGSKLSDYNPLCGQKE